VADALAYHLDLLKGLREEQRMAIAAIAALLVMNKALPG
jgi:hypothetical protein